MADLLSILQQVLQMRAGGEIQPKQLPHEVRAQRTFLAGAAGSIRVGAQQARKAVFKLLPGDRGWIAFLNRKPGSKHIADQGKRKADRFSRGAPAEKTHFLRKSLDPFFKFSDEARF